MSRSGVGTCTYWKEEIPKFVYTNNIRSNERMQFSDLNNHEMRPHVHKCSKCG